KLGHAWQQDVRLFGPPDAAGKVGQNVVRPGPLAVNGGVGDRLKPGSNRKEKHGQKRDGDDAEQRVLANAPAENAADPGDDDGVAPGDEERQPTVEDGPVDDQVDVVKPITH